MLPSPALLPKMQTHSFLFHSSREKGKGLTETITQSDAEQDTPP